jgi:hypothetical protein
MINLKTIEKHIEKKRSCTIGPSNLAHLSGPA